jgi:hypothetical protein
LPIPERKVSKGEEKTYMDYSSCYSISNGTFGGEVIFQGRIIEVHLEL